SSTYRSSPAPTSGGSRRRRGTASTERHTERTARAIAHRTNEDVPALFGCINGCGAHERAVIAAEAMQCENQRSFLVLRHLRGNEDCIRQIFAGIFESIFT